LRDDPVVQTPDLKPNMQLNLYEYFTYQDKTSTNIENNYLWYVGLETIYDFSNLFSNEQQIQPYI